jgi:hypothetical protein
LSKRRARIITVEEGFVIPIRLDLLDDAGVSLPVSRCEYVRVVSSSPDIAEVESNYMGEHMGFYFQPHRAGELHVTVIAKQKGTGEFVRDWQRLKIRGPRVISPLDNIPRYAVELLRKDD